MAASSSQAAPATCAAAVGGGTMSTTSKTIAGVHVFKIYNFSATKDLGVGKSIKSSTFHIGGHGWYIECYPCGVNEDSDGWVSFYLCRQDDHHGSGVSAECKFTLMESREGNDYDYERTVRHPDGYCRWGTDLIEREELESLVKYDCFHVRCVVSVWIGKFPAVPELDLDTETVAGSHMLTIDAYSKIREVLAFGDSIESCLFRVGGRSWYIVLHPCGKNEDEVDGVTTYICLDVPSAIDEVKVRFEMTLLTHAGQIISSIQNFNTFTEINYYGCDLFSAISEMEYESSPLLHDTLHVRCDMAIVKGITAMLNLRRGIGGDLQGSQQVRGDVTFEVGNHLFAAHRCVLTTRCTAFKAEFFGPSGKENADVTNQPVRIDNMEPRVFEALLHFIYTDALPVISEEDKVGMAQGLLVAADRYAMERLKLICGDLLCSYINDARMAITTLDLADKHGCRRLMEACKKFLMDYFAKEAP